MTDRTTNFTVRLSDAERLELDLVAAHMRMDRSAAFRVLVRERAEEIRAARREAERFRRGEWGGKGAEREGDSEVSP